ncbi:MAG: hypothetical protein LLG03_09870 [Planctomycetaceae bacterium]|nr:hypothetical protein [Planctomycetaceae bacterium]
MGEELGGRRVKCPSCGTVCEVPLPVAEVVAGPAAAPPPPVAAPAPPPVRTAPAAPEPSAAGALDELMASVAPAAAPSAPSEPARGKTGQPLRGGKVAAARKDRTPLIAFGVCFIVTVIVGVLLYIMVIRDPWEADNRQTVLTMANEVHQAVANQRYDQARAKYDELHTLIGGRTIKDYKLQQALKQALEDYQSAQGSSAALQPPADEMTEINTLLERMQQRAQVGAWQNALDLSSQIIARLESIKGTQPQAQALLTTTIARRQEFQKRLDAAQKAAREEAARAAAKARQPPPEQPKDPRAVNPGQQYARQFAADVDRAVATPETADDLAIGEKMFAEAAGASQAPTYQALLYEKAWPLCAKEPAGQGKAIEALAALEQSLPDRRAEFLAQRTNLLDQAFRTASGTARRPAAEAYLAPLTELADAYFQREQIPRALETYRRALLVCQYLQSPQEARLKEAIAKCRAASSPRELAAEAVKTLQDKLKADPADAASRTQLIYLLLTEANDPPAAAAVSHASVETSLSVNLALSVKSVSEVSEASCLTLGQWYAGPLLKRATPPAKPAMAQRAREYYRQFLKLHAAQDGAAEQVNAAIRALEKSYPEKKD